MESPRLVCSARTFVLFTVASVALTQTACLQSRLHVRDGSGYDSYSTSSAAPATGETAANAAASSYVIDELKAEIARLTGRIEELERSKAAPAPKNENEGLIQALDKRIAELEKTQLEVLERLKGQHVEAAATASQTSTSPSNGGGTTGGTGNFDRGRTAHAAGKFDDAIQALGAYISQNPNGKHVEEALFLKGESQFLIKQYKSAIVDFSKISEKFPKSKRIPLVLLKIGQSFEALGMQDDARGFYQDLVERFPKTSEAKKAKARLKG